MASGRILSSVYLGGRMLPSSNVESFEHVTDIENILPRGVLTLNDNNGELIQKFNGLEIGSQVVFQVIATTKGENDVEFGSLVNLALAERPNINNMVGRPELLLGSQWELQKDFSTHIYKGIPNSDIIKNILEDNSRGFKIPIDKIEDSDEDGSIPRFKCGIDDYTFIVKRILPYTTIKSKQVFFWINEYGKAQLDSFDNMIVQSPKVLCIPHNINISDKDKEKIKAIAGECSNKLVMYTSMTLYVGDINIGALLKPLKSKVFIDSNSFIGSTYTGVIKPTIKIGNDFGNLIASKMPLFSWVFEESNTDFKIFVNRNAADVSSYAINSTRQFMNMFRLELETNYCGDSVKTGDTVFVYQKSSKHPEEKELTYWINDKWLVTKTRHYYTSSSKDMRSVLTLCRPTFYLSKNSTDLPGIDYYYGV